MMQVDTTKQHQLRDRLLGNIRFYSNIQQLHTFTGNLYSNSIISSDTLAITPNFRQVDMVTGLSFNQSGQTMKYHTLDRTL